MQQERISIIIPIRNEHEILDLSIKYGKQNQSNEHEYIIIYDKNNKKENTKKIEGVTQLFPNDNDIINLYPQLKNKITDRYGLMCLHEYGRQFCTNDIILYLHGDMIPGPNFDKELSKHLQPKTIVSGTRIEPGVFGADKAKHQEECGREAKEFDYNKFEKACTKYSEDNVVEGFFAPHMYYKKDIISYDMNYFPQSREETDLALTLQEKGIKLLNSRSALFYHFAGRGSRRKDNNTEDSDEWKKSNYKNERNFIRKWRQPIMTNDFCAPIRQIYNETVSLGIIVGNEDPDLFTKMLQVHEPYFDKVYVCFDTTQPIDVVNKMKHVVTNYITKEKEMCEIFDENKFELFTHPLNKDFAGFRNVVANKNTCDWMLMLDVDEHIQTNQIPGIRALIQKITNDKSTVKVCGLPRLNLIDGNIVNDFMNDPNVNPDFQYRLVKKGVQWQNTYPKLGAVPGCHEMPKEVHSDKQNVVLLQVPFIVHPKSSEKQNKQNNFYNTIGISNINNNIIIDTEDDFDDIIY